MVGYCTVECKGERGEMRSEKCCGVSSGLLLCDFVLEGKQMRGM